jgi:hypothetical protein
LTAAVYVILFRDSFHKDEMSKRLILTDGGTIKDSLLLDEPENSTDTQFFGRHAEAGKNFMNNLK